MLFCTLRKKQSSQKWIATALKGFAMTTKTIESRFYANTKGCKGCKEILYF
ncbi:hypothetical protein HFN_0555 [Helicobacter fennelliae MRY12-0050]|uniref:Uncharacterized protein n=1 Tax=Helicobacter fennelliae MRY12-0050 TaxID=1325130 RepID=T1CRQ2_9HELI|nr:hypothetical protein HFN_0555 [Helicobacter fennelliae MRY12-0050]